MGCGVLCAVDPHAVGAWGVGSAVGITPMLQLRLEDAIERVVYPKVSFNSVQFN